MGRQNSGVVSSVSRRLSDSDLREGCKKEYYKMDETEYKIDVRKSFCIKDHTVGRSDSNDHLSDA